MSEDFEALKREATAWIVRIHSGQATTDDAEALVRWRAVSDVHEQAFRAAVSLWNDVGIAASRSRPLPTGQFTRRALIASGGLAASVGAIGVGLGQLGYVPSLQALLSDYATNVAEQKTAQLPDGSVVTLDGGSSVTLSFDTGVRKVELLSGAAVFDVASDRRPFVVAANNGTTTTEKPASFAVKHGPAEVSVDCLSGHVGVECRGETELAGGEGIVYSAQGLGPRNASDPDTVAGWRNGLLIFRDQPLSEVVSDLNRHRKGKVVIAGSGLSAQRVSGVFHLARPDEIIAHLQDTLSLQPIHLGQIVLLR